MGNWELPLVIFTVLSQAAIGMLLLAALVEPWIKPDQADVRRAMRLTGTLVFPILAVALIASITHLGQPAAAYRALRHVSTSWLSREIWIFGVLTLLAAGYSHLCYHDRLPGLRRVLGYASSAVGVLGLYASAMVYALPARPAWTAFSNGLAFVGTALLLGGLLIAVIVKATAPEENMLLRISGWTSAAGLVLSVSALTIVALSGPDAAPAVGLSFASPLFWGRLVAGLILPAGGVFALIHRVKEFSARFAVLALSLALLGEAAGRAIFYASALTPSLWG